MRNLLCAAVLAGALVAPPALSDPHGGCLVTPAIPTCVYTAIGPHQALGYAAGTWEAWVIRKVSGEDRKVVLADGTGPIVGDGIDASEGERVTLQLNADGPGNLPVGVVSAGNTAGHP